jgi:hypothetical protein
MSAAKYMRNNGLEYTTLLKEMPVLLYKNKAEQGHINAVVSSSPPPPHTHTHM